MAGKYVFEVNEAEFDEKVIKGEGVIIVDLWAQWCGPCLALGPTLERLADSYEGQVHIAKINVDQNQGIASKFGVRSIPTVLFFKDGEKKDQVIGNQPYATFEEKVKALL